MWALRTQEMQRRAKGTAQLNSTKYKKTHEMKLNWSQKGNINCHLSLCCFVVFVGEIVKNVVCACMCKSFTHPHTISRTLKATRKKGFWHRNE